MNDTQSCEATLVVGAVRPTSAGSKSQVAVLPPVLDMDALQRQGSLLDLMIKRDSHAVPTKIQAEDAIGKKSPKCSMKEE